MRCAPKASLYSNRILGRSRARCRGRCPHRPGRMHRFCENLRRIRNCPMGRQSRRPLQIIFYGPALCRGGRLCPPGRMYCFYGNLRRIRNFPTGRQSRRPLQILFYGPALCRGGRLCPPGRMHCFYGNLRRIRNFPTGRVGIGPYKGPSGHLSPGEGFEERTIRNDQLCQRKNNRKAKSMTTRM